MSLFALRTMKPVVFFHLSVLLLNAACVPGNPHPRETHLIVPGNRAAEKPVKPNKEHVEGSGNFEEDSREMDDDIFSGESESESEEGSGDLFGVHGAFENSGDGGWGESGDSSEEADDLLEVWKKFDEEDSNQSSNDSEVGLDNLFAMPGSEEDEESEESNEMIDETKESEEGSGESSVESSGDDEGLDESDDGGKEVGKESVDEGDEDDEGGSEDIRVEVWTGGTPEEQFGESTTFLPYWMKINDGSDDRDSQQQSDTTTGSQLVATIPWLTPKIEKILAAVPPEEPAEQASDEVQESEDPAETDELKGPEEEEGSDKLVGSEEPDGSEEKEGSGSEEIEGSGKLDGSGDSDGTDRDSQSAETEQEPTDPNEPNEEWRGFMDLFMKQHNNVKRNL